MIINKITFTGADNNTDIKLLQYIQKEIPIVEWGILISTNQNRNRYPNNEFINSLQNKGLNLSLHICGKYSREIMNDGIFHIINKFHWFNRYQINFISNNSSENLNNFINLITQFPHKTFILQSNNSNKEFINNILNVNKTNINILYDSSGGKGTNIKEIQNPYNNIYTGYSGGLCEETLPEILYNIHHFKNDSYVWIDMESGVRTEDQFDLNKVRSILKIYEDSYIKR